jgi:hypothetical protein
MMLRFFSDTTGSIINIREIPFCWRFESFCDERTRIWVMDGRYFFRTGKVDLKLK